jgi:hypothetical protein
LHSFSGKEEVTQDTSDLILRSLDELRSEVREGLRKLDSVVVSLDARVRELELWKAGQSTANAVVRETIEHDHNERGLILSKRQVNIALSSVVISAVAFTITVFMLITTGHSQ